MHMPVKAWEGLFAVTARSIAKPTGYGCAIVTVRLMHVPHCAGRGQGAQDGMQCNSIPSQIIA